MEYKRRNNLRKPFLNVFVITFNHVIPEIKQIVDFCKYHKVDQLTFRPDQLKFDNSYKGESNKKKYKDCFWPYLTMTIDTNGTVYPCSFAHGGPFNYGNIIESSLEEIWNNELYTETRKFLSGKYTKIEALRLPCYNCTKFK